MKLWLKVSNDKYELPQFICDSADELAELCGVNRNSIYSMIGKYRQKKIQTCCYRVVEVEGSEDVSK